MTRAEAAQYGVDNYDAFKASFKRDTVFESILVAEFGANYPIDSIAYVPFTNGQKFTLETGSYTNKSEQVIPLFEARVDNNIYLNGLNRQEIVNMNDDAENLGKYAGLKVGDKTTPNNNAGNWGVMQAITEIASPQLNISDTSNYTLSIRLMPGGFCFIIYQPSRMSVLGLFDYATASAEETNGSYQQNPWLQQHYAKINCAVNTNRWTLIPSDFMIDGKEEDLWHLNFGKGQHGQLQSHAIKALNSINLYEAEPLSTEFCRTTKAKEVPIQTSLLHKALILSKRTADKQLCIAQRVNSWTLPWPIMVRCWLPTLASAGIVKSWLLRSTSSTTSG